MRQCSMYLLLARVKGQMCVSSCRSRSVVRPVIIHRYPSKTDQQTYEYRWGIKKFAVFDQYIVISRKRQNIGIR